MTKSAAPPTISPASPNPMFDHACRISSSVDGFRRAGVSHPKGPIDHPAGAFTREQVEAFMAEPVLKVTPVPGDQTREE